MVLRGRNLQRSADLNKRLEDGAKSGLDALFEKKAIHWKLTFVQNYDIEN